ncbi:4'-phosphopantetheinyl transferase [Streptomyces sp. NPDC002888]|uniref:4'-phosphopantetheinyl transferase family protein n=1 Tax=Streptomyces sp. NPDC002888 TaxID=3364668 RepID=UPI003679BF6E
MIEKLLPAPVAVAEAFDDTRPAPLLGAEAELVSRAVDSRRREFATVRRCAREALAELGVGPLPVLTGERGAPRWPEGIVGSMTHCDGYRAAAVARTPGVRSVGIDAEPHLPLPEGVFDSIALPSERRRAGDMQGMEPEVHWDRLLFSMKECVYKAWFPLTRRPLGFAQADITIEYDGTFSARLPTAGPAVPATFAGRWLVDRGLIATAVLIPAVARVRQRPGPPVWAGPDVGVGLIRPGRSGPGSRP